MRRERKVPTARPVRWVRKDCKVRPVLKVCLVLKVCRASKARQAPRVRREHKVPRARPVRWVRKDCRVRPVPKARLVLKVLTELLALQVQPVRLEPQVQRELLTSRCSLGVATGTNPQGLCTSTSSLSVQEVAVEVVRLEERATRAEVAVVAAAWFVVDMTLLFLVPPSTSRLE